MPDFILYLLLVVAVIHACASIALWASLHRHDNSGRALDKRVSTLETRLGYMPTHHELAQIHSLLSELSSDVAAMRERTDLSSMTLRTIQQHLSEKPK